MAVACEGSKNQREYFPCRLPRGACRCARPIGTLQTRDAQSRRCTGHFNFSIGQIAQVRLTGLGTGATIQNAAGIETAEVKKMVADLTGDWVRDRCLSDLLRFAAAELKGSATKKKLRSLINQAMYLRFPLIRFEPSHFSKPSDEVAGDR